MTKTARLQLHIYRVSLYSIEAGRGAGGGNALKDRLSVLAGCRRALALGGTVTAPQLFAAAGASFAFDVETVGEAVALVEATLTEVDTA